jgi:hypothetical protein
MGVKNRDFGLTNCVVGVFRYQILHNIGASLFAVSSNTRKVISILPDETGTKAQIFAQGDSPDFQHHAPMTVSSADLLHDMPSFMSRVCSGYAPFGGVLRTPSV